MDKWSEKIKEDIEVPEIVLDKVEEAFAQIRMESGKDMAESNKKKHHFKEKWKALNVWSKVAAMVAVVLLLGSGSVYAASHIPGIRDFIWNMPDDAEQYINTEVDTDNSQDNLQNTDKKYVVSDDMLETLKDKVSFSVKETVTDQNSCHLFVEATLTDTEHYLLVPEEYNVSREDDNFYSASEYYEDAGEDESIEEYAKRIGKQMLLVESLFQYDENDPGDYMESHDGKMEDESRALLHIELQGYEENSGEFKEGTQIPIVNRVQLYVDGESVWKECKNENVTVTIEKVAVEEESASYALENNQEMRVENGPVIIKSIKLTNTALETKVHFAVINEDEEIGNWLGINLIDDEGNIFDRGTSDGGYSSVPDGNGMFSCNRSYKKMEFPDHVNVRVRNLETDEVYELRNIPLVK